jgi:hypothetical protein
VDLDRQRLLGREDLEQERQPAESGGHHRAERRLRVGRDHGVQGRRAAVAQQRGGRGRVCAEPQFRLGPGRRYGAAPDPGDHVV